MNEKVYVVQEQNDCNDTPVKAYLTEDAAREHICNRFMQFKDELHLTDGDFEWEESDCLVTGGECEEHRWVMYARDMEYGAFAHQFAMPQGLGDVLYVCQRTDDDDGCPETKVERVYATEDEAREWMRKQFLAHVDRTGFSKDDYTWGDWEEDEDGKKGWHCGYNLDYWEVYVYAVPVVR